MSISPPDDTGTPRTPAAQPTPRPTFWHRRRLLVGVVFLLAVTGTVTYFGWKRESKPLDPDEAAYEQYVEAFELGTAALDVGVWDVSEQNFDRAIELIPQEPAAWANRGLMFIRTSRLPLAAGDLAEAEKRAPDDPDIQKLIGVLEEQQGRLGEAIARFRRAVEKSPEDVEALYHLADLIDRADPLKSDNERQKERQELIERILAVRPTNLFVLTTRFWLAVDRNDRAAVADSVARFEQLAPGWGAESRAEFQKMKLARDGDPGAAEAAARTLGNVLKAEPAFPRGSSEVKPQEELGTPLRTFLKIPPVRNSPAPPDPELTFTSEPVPDAPTGLWDVAVPVWLGVHGSPTIFVANAKEIRSFGPGVPLPSLPLAPDGLVPIDWNNDFRTDLLVVGPAGLLFYQQGPDGNFTDVTAKTKLPSDVLKGNYTAALAADVDLDGDLDILLARRTGSPLLLRNNLDGTFTAQPMFPDIDGARAFAWADFDHDGAPDLAILDARGHPHVFANERMGQFRPWPVAPPGERFLALTVTDADDDGVLDLVALREDGAVVRICSRNKRARWDVAELGRWDSVPAGAEPGTLRLLSADLDNNGVPDLVVSGRTGSAAWLGAGNGTFQPLAAALPPHIFAAANLGCGHPDLLTLNPDSVDRNAPVRFHITGSKKYHGQTIRFRAQVQDHVDGDNRINSFGIGGEIEIRTGTHVVKRPITHPSVHIGLGGRPRADVVRITWPNGVSQIEFRFPIDHTIAALQRIKGSCPFLFTWNGERFVFVTDFMWSTPLGMYINAQDQGGFLQTSEWVKIRGDQLVPRDGHYEVRVNANLWETHFFDYLALRVVDHPADTELFADERFMLVPSKPTYHITGPTHPVARAWDHHGADVTEIVRAIDGKYLDRAGRGLYQGITNDHWVEVDLGDDAPREGPVWLIANGWLHPTDSSVNYAIEQGRHARPQALVLEVPDGKGGWKVARDKLGFPAGKHKTITLRLDGLDGPGVPRRFRLRTNMEIYWDALHYAQGREGAPLNGRGLQGEPAGGSPSVNEKELLPVVADLHHRGILAMSQVDPSSPELPDYDNVISTRQVWRDLIGYHTRDGDIRELLEKIDDRYAIVTAGDEITLRFAVPPGPPPGWKRDFIWVSDGWVKDGDLNTRFGKTVLPLPAHDMVNYTVPPTRLEDDPVFRRHRQDWDVFHTRYVTPDNYERGLRTFKPR